MLLIRLLTVFLVSLSSVPVRAATYQFDPVHTILQFEIDHLWLFTERGQFDRAHGILEYDAEQHSGSLEVVIDAGSLDTGNEERDAVLRGADWFDVSRYPGLSFRSQRFIFERDYPMLKRRLRLHHAASIQTPSPGTPARHCCAPVHLRCSNAGRPTDRCCRRRQASRHS